MRSWESCRFRNRFSILHGKGKDAVLVQEENSVEEIFRCILKIVEDVYSNVRRGILFGKVYSPYDMAFLGGIIERKANRVES